MSGGIGPFPDIERAKEAVRTFYAAARGGFEAALAAHSEFFDSSEVLHVPGQLPLTFEEHHALDRVLYTAFPDLELSLDDIIAEGDKVVARFTLRGTHAGKYLEVAPTGKRIETTGIAIYRFAGAKIVEEWYQSDQLGLFQQLGLLPGFSSLVA